MKDDIADFATKAPEMTKALVDFVLELTPDAARAAILLLVAAHAITRYYGTPSFDDLIRLVKASEPNKGN